MWPEQCVYLEGDRRQGSGHTLKGWEGSLSHGAHTLLRKSLGGRPAEGTYARTHAGSLFTLDTKIRTDTEVSVKGEVIIYND